MRVQALSREEVLRALVTSEAGLTEAEARRRLGEHGLNEIREARGIPLYIRFLSQFTHFLALLLWVAAALCFVSDYLNPGEGMLTLGLAILGVILLNALFTFVQEYRAERAVAALRRLLPFKVKVLREGVVKQIPATEVVPGEVILLAEGDKVPADARLLEAHRLMVNNAPLTGESEPQSRNAEPFLGEYLDSPNLVFAGTLVVAGSGRAVVLATGMATEFGKIAHLTGAVLPGASPLRQEIVRLTRVVAAIALTMGMGFFVLGWFLGRSFWSNFLFTVGLLVANVPEGLLPTVTLALAMGSQRLAAKKALIKNLAAVETLGSVTVICSDKTGTLTQNRMEVRRLWLAPASPPGEAQAKGMLWKIAYFCNNASFDDRGYHGDPTEVAILKASREAGGDLLGERLGELPFDSERKRMTTVTRVDGQLLVLTKGALETVLPCCTRLLVGDTTKTLETDEVTQLKRAAQEFMDVGLRVLAFAFKLLEPLDFSPQDQTAENWEADLTLVGLMGLEDPPRPGVREAINTCRQAGIRVIMLTGDAGRTAVALAREIGLVGDNPIVLEDQDLRALSDGELHEILTRPEVIFARMSPRHKLRLVSLLQEAGERVAVTGDGVNDAPALKKADIGIAMGLTGTDVAREAADLVLLDDNFTTIVRAVEEGRGIFENIRKFISYIFASNIPEIVPYLAYILFQLPLPLTILQILAVDLGTDIFPALALGAEKPTPAMMRQPPRAPGEHLLKLGLLLRAYLFLGPLEALAAMTGYFYVLLSGGWEWGQSLSPGEPLYLAATSACFLAIVITQVGNVFACRSFSESLLSLGLFSNPLVLFGVATELLLALWIIYHPWGNAIFGTAPLPGHVWLVLLPFGVGLLLLEELRKLLVRHFHPSPG